MRLDDLWNLPPWEWPEDAGEVVATALRNRSLGGEARLRAARLSGDLAVMDDEMADLLLSIIPDKTEAEDLRAQAAISLGAMLESADTEGFDDDGISEPPVMESTFRKAQDTLRSIYADPAAPKDVRRRALEASVRASEDWHPAAVRAAAQSDDESWKLTAAFAMRFVSGFDDEILELLESQNEDVRFEALTAAGVWQVEAAWPYIHQILTAENPSRNLVLAALGAAPSLDLEAAEDLLDPYLDSDDEELVETAQEALDMARMAREYDGEEDEEEEEDENGRKDWVQ